MLAFFGFASLSALEHFLPERPRFERELRGGYHGVAPYFFSKVGVSYACLSTGD